ncbi:MAG: hypothetical protein P4L69_20845 [Desulfosporosinus sp.]|nr:hypothetical protein [Desulfosporosinus sp.]
MSRQIKTTRINNVQVKTVTARKAKDERPAKGSKLFEELSCNIFLCAKKFSGKTVSEYNIIKNCASKETKIIAYCATIHNDDTWIAIQDYCKEKGIEFEGHTSIFDEDGDNLVEILVKEWREIMKEEEEGKDEDDRMGGQEKGGAELDQRRILSSSGERMVVKSTGEKKEKKPKRTKYRPLKYMIIFDDVSIEIGNKWITALVKIHRHFDSKIIFSSQDIIDMAKGARNQMNYVLLFKDMPKERIEKVWKNCALPITFGQLEDMYEVATEKPYSFLYIDCPHNRYRINFSEEIEIPPPRENEKLKRR